MSQPDYEIVTLSNGLRCVFRSKPGVTYCGVAVGAGTRNEVPGQEGLAHFVEHTIFKGTEKRRSSHISSRMESIGGELNAYTTKEETMVYTVAPPGYLERALELLADLVANCTFPAAEIEREKEVVIDEINSYLDTPSEAIFDEYEDLMYAGSGLGHNILGTPQSVKALSGADCRRFVESHYTPANMVLYCVSDVPARKAFKLMEKHFAPIHRASAPLSAAPATPPLPAPFDLTRDLGLHQSHTLMGARVFGRRDERRYALFLLNNYLGGPAMNSVLNRELRDKRGYVYTVDSMVGLLSDCGLFEVYFGCDREHIKPCKRIIRSELMKLAETPMKPRVFDAAVRQYIGQLQVSASYAESQAMNLGKSLLYYGKVLDIATTRKALTALTPRSVSDIAALICANGLSSLTLC